MRAIWKEIPRDARAGKWAGMYVTLNPKGVIVMTRLTWQKSGSPEAYQKFFDDANQRIGLKPSTPNSRGAYPVNKNGRCGGRRISAFRLIAECRLLLKNTLEFPLADIDHDGVLILDLRTAEISKRSLTWERRRLAAKPGLDVSLG
jgi:hypothetical protein